MQPEEDKVKQYESWLQRDYGGLLRLQDIARILRYPSVQAVRQARYRGTLPLEVFKVPSRRGWFATSRAVAQLLVTLDIHEPIGLKEDTSMP